MTQLTSDMTDCIDHARLTPAEFRTAFHVYYRALAEWDGRMMSASVNNKVACEKAWQQSSDSTFKAWAEDTKKLIDDYNALVDKHNALITDYNRLLGIAQGLSAAAVYAPRRSLSCTSNTIGIYTYTDCH